ncbi:uncharacterized protein LOC144926882 [Branchiostoma floridae x Branchiostoma belcheri]
MGSDHYLRAEVKKRDPTSSLNQSEYSRLNKLVKKSCKVDDNNWALRVATELETASSHGNQREVWQKIRILANKKCKKSSAVRDKSGKLISDPDSQRERWAEHFSELLNPQQDDVDLTVLDSIPGVPCFTYLGDDDGPPTVVEIQDALRRLKNHKSPGVDGIANEQLKYVKYIRVLQAFFYNTVSAVRVNGEQSNWFTVNSGTGQGDIQGPPVFNVCINLAAYLTEQSKHLSAGAVLQKETHDKPSVSVLDTDYADDMALLDNTKTGLQETTDLLCKNSSLAGLKANAKKTQAMVVGKHTTQRPYTEVGTLDIKVEGSQVEQVSRFTYLGTTFSSDGTTDSELSNRIQKASGAFNQLGKIWNNRNILDATKLRIYEAAVITILTYGSEVWITTQAQVNRLETFHQRCLRRILHIKWFQHVTNKSVLQKADTVEIGTRIANNRLRWLGHLLRMPEERLPKFLLEWTPNYGKRSRGRPRKTWLACVLEDARTTMQQPSLTLEDLKTIAHDRQTLTTMRRMPEMDSLAEELFGYSEAELASIDDDLASVQPQHAPLLVI